MGLLSFFKRNAAAAGESSASALDPVENARTRARRRLIGATVLLGIGVVGFPLVFESQPRPIPVDIPIEIPRREAAAPLVVPPAPRSGPAAAAPSLPPVTEDAPASAAVAKPASRPAAEVTAERATELGRVVVPAASVPAAARATAPASSVAMALKPTGPASAARAATAPRADDGRRAQALLEGRTQAAVAAPAASNQGARLVVQVGAYTDVDKLREARVRVERLGLKTYTQVIESDGGKRTRVRVGPFATRDEADKAAARIRAAGLPVAILAL